MILESGLLFWATLYSYVDYPGRRSFRTNFPWLGPWVVERESERDRNSASSLSPVTNLSSANK